MDGRANLIRGWLESSTFPTQGLEITTNGGDPLPAGTLTVTLEGLAPTEIWSIVVSGLASEEQPDTEFSTTDMLGWTLTDIPVEAGVQSIELLGLDRDGSVVDTVSIGVE